MLVHSPTRIAATDSDWRWIIMIIEFQLRTETLLALVHNGLLTRALCVPADPPGASPEKPSPALVDHIELRNTPLLDRSEDTGVLQVGQNVVLFFVTPGDLAKNGLAASPLAGGGVSFTVFFNLTLDLVSGVATLATSFAGLDFGALGLDKFGADARAKVADRLKAVHESRKLDITPLVEALGTTFKITKVGMNTFPKGPVGSAAGVALRLESLVEGEAGTDWDKFRTGAIADRLGTHDWSMLIDSQILLPVVRQRRDRAEKSQGLRSSSPSTATFTRLGPRSRCSRHPRDLQPGC